jgi:hypothetical protein
LSRKVASYKNVISLPFAKDSVLNKCRCLHANDSIAHVIFHASPNGQAKNDSIPHLRLFRACGRSGTGACLLSCEVNGVVSEDVEAATSSANFSREAVADSTAAVPSKTLCTDCCES